ncbi:4-hydroxyphenylpyruvate dioxygenase [Myxococcus virescens]|uniref:4-hydroxyphenylpyruvate dioxygenase n=1 Tax=Myxococcus virescens TaxID=83456 RepID=UPI003DA5B8F7
MRSLLHDIAHIEFWVEDARVVAECYQRVFGFDAIAEAGPETGLAGHRSIVLAQGDATFVVTSSVDGSGPVAEFTRQHGDGVRDVAFAVDDATQAFNEAVALGATPVEASAVVGLTKAGRTIRGFGDVVHSFVESRSLPDFFRPLSATSRATSDVGIRSLDHVAVCLPTGELDTVAEFYKRVLGFEDGHAEYVETELSGMNARVVQRGPIRFPLQEPLAQNPTGPIAEFLTLNRGAGVYHLGLLTDDICRTLHGLRGKVKALDVPDTYYEQLPNRVAALDVPMADLREFKVLVDPGPGGILLQTFTRSLHPRQTFFIEIIQRKGAVTGFGSGNIRALFDAVEADRIALAANTARG